MTVHAFIYVTNFVCNVCLLEVRHSIRNSNTYWQDSIEYQRTPKRQFCWSVKIITSLEALSAAPPYECTTVYYELMHLDVCIMFIFGANSIWRVPFIRIVDDGSPYIQNPLDVWTLNTSTAAAHTLNSQQFVRLCFFLPFFHFPLLLHNHIFKYNTSSLAAWEKRFDLIHFSMVSCDFHFVSENESRTITNWYTHARRGCICI